MKKKLETMWPPLEARVGNPNRIVPAVARFIPIRQSVGAEWEK
jgi:hypothetical protein